MVQYLVSLEGHRHCVTMYVAGRLAEPAATVVTEMLGAVRQGVRIVRVDLRSVTYVDPLAFVELARVLARWRDGASRRVRIEFPGRALCLR
jgi:ABC-type transporter Mla MlaB component